MRSVNKKIGGRWGRRRDWYLLRGHSSLQLHVRGHITILLNKKVTLRQWRMSYTKNSPSFEVLKAKSSVWLTLWIHSRESKEPLYYVCCKSFCCNSKTYLASICASFSKNYFLASTSSVSLSFIIEGSSCTNYCTWLSITLLLNLFSTCFFFFVH